jgi:hypothetical protein
MGLEPSNQAQHLAFTPLGLRWIFFIFNCMESFCESALIGRNQINQDKVSMIIPSFPINSSHLNRNTQSHSANSKLNSSEPLAGIPTATETDTLHIQVSSPPVTHFGMRRGAYKIPPDEGQELLKDYNEEIQAAKKSSSRAQQTSSYDKQLTRKQSQAFHLRQAARKARKIREHNVDVSSSLRQKGASLDRQLDTQKHRAKLSAQKAVQALTPVAYQEAYNPYSGTLNYHPIYSESSLNEASARNASQAWHQREAAALQTKKAQNLDQRANTVNEIDGWEDIANTLSRQARALSLDDAYDDGRRIPPLRRKSEPDYTYTYTQPSGFSPPKHHNIFPQYKTSDKYYRPDPILEEDEEPNANKYPFYDFKAPPSFQKEIDPDDSVSQVISNDENRNSSKPSKRSNKTRQDYSSARHPQQYDMPDIQEESEGERPQRPQPQTTRSKDRRRPSYTYTYTVPSFDYPQFSTSKAKENSGHRPNPKRRHTSDDFTTDPTPKFPRRNSTGNAHTSKSKPDHNNYYESANGQQQHYPSTSPPPGPTPQFRRRYSTGETTNPHPSGDYQQETGYANHEQQDWYKPKTEKPKRKSHSFSWRKPFSKNKHREGNAPSNAGTARPFASPPQSEASFARSAFQGPGANTNQVLNPTEMAELKKELETTFAPIKSIEALKKCQTTTFMPLRLKARAPNATAQDRFKSRTAEYLIKKKQTKFVADLLGWPELSTGNPKKPVTKEEFEMRYKKHLAKHPKPSDERLKEADEYLRNNKTGSPLNEKEKNSLFLASASTKGAVYNYKGWE